MATAHGSSFSLAALAAFTATFVACSTASPRDGATKPTTTTPDTTNVVAAPKLAVPCTDSLASVDGAPGDLNAPAGTIFRCAPEKVMTRTEVQALLDANGFVGPKATSGASIFRILYRTERATTPATPGYSSGVVLLPDTPRADKVPVVSVSHGATGQSPKCAQSKQGFDNPKSDFISMAVGMVASGLPVVASDYAGFSNYGAKGNPPSGMAFSEDVAKSTLDSIRALRAMAPEHLSEKVVLVGQSQGGHTALSTLALAEGYAPDISITAVKVFTPLWFNQASWGAIFLLGEQFALEKDTFPTAVGLWYLYSHAALLDGSDLDSAGAVFAKDKRAIVRQFFDESCDSSSYALLQNVAKLPADLYDPDFVDGVMPSAALGAPCPTDGSRRQAFCDKWVPRYAADRPHLAGKAATVPILLTYGGKDTTIPPERATCGIERLQRDRANLTVCFDKTATHSSIVRSQGGRAVQWVAQVALGEAPSGGASAPCDGDATAILDSAGAPATCAPQPPND